jgi:hypothetical protein
LRDNYLSTDLRIPVTLLQTNVCTSLGTNATSGHIWDRFSSDTYKALPSVGSITWSHPITGQNVEYAMPAGGRGYVRPPSLISVWSTAPFFTNNTLGPFEPDPSVELRLRAFSRAVEQLLWPEKRQKDPALGGQSPGTIDRTTTSTFIGAQFIGGGVDLGPIPKGTPVGLFANLDLRSDDADSNQRTTQQAKVQALIQAVRNATPGTDGGQQFTGLVESMLSLSKCPDFVVNRGHYFGSDLADADKRALIEFLKTF